MNRDLSVRVNNRQSGQITLEDEEFIFNYHTETDKNNFVSLSMPVRKKNYIHKRLHPIFEMQLPEGYLRAVIQKHFAKLTETDDFGLLNLLSPSIRGRLAYGNDNNFQSSPYSLDELITPLETNLFQELIERFALHSPLSGVQPKVLATVTNKATLTLDQYIVKAWGQDYPELALNEFICMTAVKAAGIPVPEFYLSSDSQLFIMKRFDIVPNERCLGFEDMCVLQGKSREDKYNSSYERIAKTIKSFVSPLYQRQSLEQFFKMLVINTHLQNGDAHLKNFGVVYNDETDVKLSPAYDVVSTSCYIRNDVGALTMMGSKKWWSQKFLIQFAQTSCDISKLRAEVLYEECMKALQKVMPMINEKLNNSPTPHQKMVLEHIASLIQKKI